MSSTDQRVILVTGANKGIGFEAVRLLSEQLPSATILLGTRSLANGEAALSKLQQSPNKPAGASYSNVHPLVLDVSDAASVSKAAEEVKAKHGRLDVLINNHGISNVDGDRLSPQVVDVNLHGVHRCIEAFLPLMPPHSTLVTVSSEVGSWTTHKCPPELQQRLMDPSLTYAQITELGTAFFTPSHGPWGGDMHGAYGVSKALCSAYMRRVALEHQEIKVVVVCPGYCATDLNHNMGFRTAAQGGESVIFPVVHGDRAAHGKFYQDGKELEWNCAAPAFYKPTPIQAK